MGAKACLYMAFKNFVVKKKTMLKLTAAYAMVIVVVLSLYGYRNSIEKQLNTITDTSASACYVETDAGLDLDDYSLITEIKSIRKFDPMIPIDQITLITGDGTEHPGINNFDYDYEMDMSPGTSRDLYSVPFKIDAYSPEGVVFSAQDQREFLEKNESTTLVPAGKAVPDENGIVMSDDMLERFGLRADAGLLGTQITLANHETGEIYVNGLTLTGIINSRIFYTEANRYSAHIIIPESQATEAYDPPEYRYYANDYSSTYKLAMEIGANKIRCRYNSFLEMYKIIENQRLIVNKVVSVILITLFLALSVSVMTVMYFYYRQHKKYRLMLRAIGMKNADVFACALIEQLLCLLSSAIVGTILSWILIRLINLQLSGMLYVTIVLEVQNLILLLLLTVVILMIFSAIVAAFGCYRLTREPISASLSQ